MSTDLIAVTGATGLVGGRVAQLLAEAGAPRRLVVRDPSRLRGADDGAEGRVASGSLAIREGVFARVSGDVEALTGRRPTSLAEDLAAPPRSPGPRDGLTCSTT